MVHANLNCTELTDTTEVQMDYIALSKKLCFLYMQVCGILAMTKIKKLHEWKHVIVEGQKIVLLFLIIQLSF